MPRTENDWIRAYEQKGALWIHDGNPNRPHAELTSGEHSTGFFNSGMVMEDALLLDEVCESLVKKLHASGTPLHLIDRVVGPAMGAITLADGIARHIARLRKTPCLSGYTEKDKVDGQEVMVFKRTRIARGERVLRVEDVITTGSSLERTGAAITKDDGTMLEKALAIVNRSDLSETPQGGAIIALINRPMPKWELTECPLCQQGSEALRPKGSANWARLNANY